MSKLSVSFTLGKASTGNANIQHNNREFISSNVDVTRTANNISYIRQDINEAYEELFGDALREYNAKQTRNDRKINDYFQHISQDNRKESHYEVLVQFGDADTAGIGSKNSEIAIKMLDEYMRSFRERNPNLYVVNSVLHLDESTPHLHIDFIPFYTKGGQKGLSKGVSMRAALGEQGFTNQSKKLNSMVAWENSEKEVMESILNSHEFDRDIKGATHAHKSVPEFKASQDWKKLPKRKKNPSPREIIENDLRKSQEENSLLKVENEKLTTERNSPWKSFFYSDSDKQIFVQSKLSELNIPFRECENGFEAQQCYIGEIRKLEKQYVSNPNSHRENLRNCLDKLVMQVSSYDKIFEGLEFYGYEIKQGKYTSVKPKNGKQFIRLKSLGEMYNEQALRNRIQNRNLYESQVSETLNSIKDKQSLEYRIHLTVKQYIITFKSGVLPARKVDKKQPFTFINDVELDRLASLNKKINEGVTIQGLRGDLAQIESEITDAETKISTLKNELMIFQKLHSAAYSCYKYGAYNLPDMELLEKYQITSKNYSKLDIAISQNETEIGKLEKALSVLQADIINTSETLTAFERIMSMTYVDALVAVEKERRQALKIGNGLKSADSSIGEANRVGAIAERLVDAVEVKSAETVRNQSPKPRR